MILYDFIKRRCKGGVVPKQHISTLYNKTGDRNRIQNVVHISYICRPASTARPASVASNHRASRRPDVAPAFDADQWARGGGGLAERQRPDYRDGTASDGSGRRAIVGSFTRTNPRRPVEVVGRVSLVNVANRVLFTLLFTTLRNDVKPVLRPHATHCRASRAGWKQ